MNILKTTLIAGALALSHAQLAQAASVNIGFDTPGDITFNGVDGRNVASVNYGTGTMTITAAGGERWLYDTGSNGADPDLTAPFTDAAGSGTTLSPKNVLIIQETLLPTGQSPDDDAGGGSYLLSFSEAVFLESIDVFDVKQGAITFTTDGGGVFTNSFNSDTGNDPTNNLFETIDFGGVSIISLAVTLEDSGAIDNIRFSPIPIPAAVWLFGSALLGLAGVARRRRA